MTPPEMEPKKELEDKADEEDEGRERVEWFKEFILWLEVENIADMEGSGCGMCRLREERGLIPGDLSLASDHFRGALTGALQPRGSISKLAWYK